MRLCYVFFFQAEDGIRDLVRSRGLGDVYKRQVRAAIARSEANLGVIADFVAANDWISFLARDPVTVSYTHLTLQTSDLV